MGQKFKYISTFEMLKKSAKSFVDENVISISKINILGKWRKIEYMYGIHSSITALWPVRFYLNQCDPFILKSNQPIKKLFS